MPEVVPPLTHSPPPPTSHGCSEPEDYGTEDPRLTYDPSTATYHLFYTCFSSSLGPRLCHATTADPTAPYPGSWVRLGQVFPALGAGTKSAALVLRQAPPHYLFWGAGTIALAVSEDLVSFTTVNPAFIEARPGNFDSNLVEAGPSPMVRSWRGRGAVAQRDAPPPPPARASASRSSRTATSSSSTTARTAGAATTRALSS